MKASERPWSGDYVERCPLLYVMELIGSKWKLPILWCLNEEDGLHYNELKRRVHGVTNTMLTTKRFDLFGKRSVSSFFSIACTQAGISLLYQTEK